MSDPNDPVLLAIDGGVATLTLNRPEALNAIDVATAEALLARVEAIAARDDVRAILLKGAGKAFCAGGDISRFTDGGDPDQAIGAIIGPFHAALRRLEALPQPTLACLHGAVAGGGFSLALSCDFAIAAETAKFTLAYARLGTTPDGGSTYHLPRVVGLRKAKELIMLADVIDAGEALRLGLVNRVVPIAELEAAARAFAERLAAGPTQAYGRTRALLSASDGNTLAEQLEAEREAFSASTRTQDFREGVAAFLGKRPPRFSGR